MPMATSRPMSAGASNTAIIRIGEISATRPSYDRMIVFGRALPRIRRCVARDLGRRALPREKVLATIVR